MSVILELSWMSSLVTNKISLCIFKLTASYCFRDNWIPCQAFGIQYVDVTQTFSKLTYKKYYLKKLSASVPKAVSFSMDALFHHFVNEWKHFQMSSLVSMFISSCNVVWILTIAWISSIFCKQEKVTGSEVWVCGMTLVFADIKTDTQWVCCHGEGPKSFASCRAVCIGCCIWAASELHSKMSVIVWPVEETLSTWCYYSLKSKSIMMFKRGVLSSAMMTADRFQGHSQKPTIHY